MKLSIYDIAYEYFTLFWPSNLAVPIGVKAEVIADFQKLLSQGWTANEMMSCLREAAEKEPGVQPNLLAFFSKRRRLRQNLLQVEDVYFHSELRIFPHAPVIDVDIDTGVITHQEQEYFLEYRACYTIEEMVDYYSRAVAPLAMHQYNRWKGMFQHLLKTFTVDHLLFMVDALADRVRSGEVPEPDRPIVVQDYERAGVTAMQEYYTELVQNGGLNIVYKPGFPWTEGGVALPKFHRNIAMQVSEIENFRVRNNNIGLYTTAYRYQTSDQKGLLWADHLYNDFDSNLLTNPDPAVAETGWRMVVEDVRHAVSVYEIYYGITPDQLEFYFSGKKGISLLVPAICLGYQPHEYLNEIFRDMIAEVKTYCPNDTLDTKIYDRVRLWRLINSQHEDTGLYKVPLDWHEVVSTDLNGIRELARCPRPNFQRNQYPIGKAIRRVTSLIKNFKPHRVEEAPGRRLKFTPPCVDSVLNFQVGEGKRNNSAVALASFFKQSGKTLEETQRIMDEWNGKCCYPHMPANELKSTVLSAYRTNKTWGCASMINLGGCDAKGCKFARRKKVG